MVDNPVTARRRVLMIVIAYILRVHVGNAALVAYRA